MVITINKYQMDILGGDARGAKCYCLFLGFSVFLFDFFDTHTLACTFYMCLTITNLIIQRRLLLIAYFSLKWLEESQMSIQKF